MQNWMRKHRRLIFFFIFIFIGIPFVFMWGKPSSRPGSTPADSPVVAQVGGIPITESEFRRALDAQSSSRSQQSGERPTYAELDRDGTAQSVLEQLVDTSLLRLRSSQRNFTLDKRVLEKQMQKWEIFQDENGVFNHEIWNEWVGTVDRWNEIYADMEEQMGRQMYLSLISAPARRMIGARAQEELKGDHTKFKVKFAKIEAKIDVTEEDALKHFEDNPETYRLPEQHKVEFIACSLAPDVPELATELVEKLRAGEDFMELAKENSTLNNEGDIDLGWITAEDHQDAHMEALFALEAGAVSDPVSGPLGFYIFKNEEERIDPDSEEREVLGRQMVIQAMITPEETAIREKTLSDVARKIEDGTDPATAAEEAGLSLGSTDFFDRTATEIENLSMNDLFVFRSQVIAKKDTPWEVIKGRDNLFITHVTESREGAVPEFSDVKEDAENNYIAEVKRSEEYLEKLADYGEKIKEEISRIEEIETKFPELDLETGETEEAFTRKDMLFQQKVYVQAMDVFEAFKEALPGDIAGPLKGFFGDSWFFELIEKTEPDESELEEFADEVEAIENRLTMNAGYEIMSDFMKDLRERMLASVTYQQNNDVLDRILGRGKYAIEEEDSETDEETGAETADTDSVEEDTADETPAENDDNEE
ncbi:MAG: hypothetical protein GX130_03720 [Candidatus Hydrogenedens sp.]|jgi:hypothetical protein|nr:hypothetical protein [Candidatus Hydrogenedens sp.]